MSVHSTGLGEDEPLVASPKRARRMLDCGNTRLYADRSARTRKLQRRQKPQDHSRVDQSVHRQANRGEPLSGCMTGGPKCTRPAGGSGPDRTAGVKRQQQHPLDTRPEPDFQAFARCRVASRLGLSLPFVAAKLACIEVGKSGLRRLREATPGPRSPSRRRTAGSPDSGSSRLVHGHEQGPPRSAAGGAGP